MQSCKGDHGWGPGEGTRGGAHGRGAKFYYYLTCCILWCLAWLNDLGLFSKSSNLWPDWMKSNAMHHGHLWNYYRLAFPRFLVSRNIFSFPLSDILVQLLLCKDESKDYIKLYLPWMYSWDLEVHTWQISCDCPMY